MARLATNESGFWRRRLSGEGRMNSGRNMNWEVEFMFRPEFMRIPFRGCRHAINEQIRAAGLTLDMSRRPRGLGRISFLVKDRPIKRPRNPPRRRAE